MSYILYRSKPTAKQTHNSFKVSTRIAETAQGSRTEAERLLAKAYWNAIMASAGASKRQAVGLLPPAGSLWTWNRSFEIALEIASQQSSSEVAILVPDSANIIVGKDTMDLSDEEFVDALDDLDFVMSNDVKDDDDTSIDNQKKRMAKMSQDEEEAIDAIIKDCSNGFPVFLRTILSKTKISASSLAKKANLTTSIIARLRDGDVEVPPKSTVLAIGVALKLDVSQFTMFMNSAGYMFSTAVPRDQVVLYYVNKGVYDVSKINKTLFLKGMPVLGAHNGESVIAV